MKLRQLFIKIFSIISILLILLIISSIFMYRNNIALVQSNINRFKSFEIAEELRKTSDDLTSYARTYVQTGDTIWENKYWEVLDIRNGKKPRPDGATISLQDSMKKLGFTKAELDKLKIAELNSNNLVWTEKVAFNAMKGLFADYSGHFSIKNKPDTAMARRIMFDDKYHQDKSIIMTPIDECINMVMHRTNSVVEKGTKLNKDLLHLIIALIIIISLLSFISYFLIKNSIAKQIGELQKAKNLAEHNEEKFRFLFERSPDIITVTTTEGEYIDCNPATLKFHKLHSIEDLKNINTTQSYVNPSEREEILGTLRKEGFVRNKEIKLKNANGTLAIDGLISCELINTTNNETRILSWIRDISEKIKTETTILKLSTAISQNPAAIVITDLSGRIEYVNQQFSNITGYTIEEAIGSNPSILKSGIHSKEFYKNLWNTILSRKTWKGEIYNKRKNGSFFWEAATIAPILNDKNEIVNIVAIKQDITAKKEAEIALIESQKKLKELNDTKDKLFSIIGHDLRGPIGNLYSFIDLIITDVKLTDTQQLKNILDVLRSSTSDVYDLLENLLLWAKSQQNDVVFSPLHIDLYQVLETNISLLKEIAKKKSVTIHNNIPKDFVVYIDKNMIMTVIRNLIMNAIKFTQNDKNIYLSVVEDNQSFTVCVKDEGIGINPADLNKLFNPAINYTTSGTSGEKGTGLGLLLCKDFIEKHNGKIWVESEPGKGSEFKFSIPKNMNEK